MAPGYGPIMAKATNPEGGDVELRLVPDDVPIRGRILDTQGQPISGVTVEVLEIHDPPTGDLDALLESGGIERGRSYAGFYIVAWWRREGSDSISRRSRPVPTAGSGSTARAEIVSSFSSSKGRGSAAPGCAR